MNSRTEWYNMFVKIVTILLIAFIATSEEDEVWDDITAKWAIDPADGYYHLPQSFKDAERQGWTEISGVEPSDDVQALGYFGDPRLVLLFSNLTGEIVGHQIGILVADIENAGVPVNYTENPAITKKTLNGEEFFTATAFYREHDGETDSRKIWLEVEGRRVEIPTEIDSLIQNTSYHAKDCVETMGQHYYKMNSTINCSIFPWFLLGIGNDVIGIRFQAIGNSSAAPKRTWFETLPPTHLGQTAPDEPACVTESVTKYGVISFHVWFKKDPLAITCKDEFTAVYNSTLVREQSSDSSD